MVKSINALLTRLTEYEIHHLAEHLASSGYVDELHHLLALEMGDGKNVWYEVKNLRGELSDYQKDIERAWQCTWLAAQHMPSSAKSNQLSLQVRYALITASLNSIAKNMTPALIEALIVKGLWKPVHGLAYARQLPNTGQRASAMAKLASHLSPRLREGVLREVLLALPAIERVANSGEVVARLAPYLSKPLLKEAIVATQAMHNDARAKALTGLAPYLPTDLLQEALVAAREESLDRVRGMSLVGLLPYLPRAQKSEVLQDAIAAAFSTQKTHSSGKYKAIILSGLIRHLEEPQKSEILRDSLAEVQIISGVLDGIEVLTYLLPHLSAPFKEMMLQGVLQSILVGECSLRELNALTHLKPYFSGTLWDKVLQKSLVPLSGQRLQDALARARAMEVIAIAGSPSLAEITAHARAEALIRLVPLLSKSLRGEVLQDAIKHVSGHGSSGWYATVNSLASFACRLVIFGCPNEALEVARSIKYEWRENKTRADTFIGLIPFLPESLKEEASREALRTALEINFEPYHFEVLEELAPHLEKSLLQEALAELAKISDKDDRDKSLAELALQLIALDYSQGAIIAMKEIQNEQLRADTLVKIAPQLPKPTIEEALLVAQSIDDHERRIMACVGLAPYLPDQLRGSLLQEILGIEDRYVHSRAFYGILPHLSELPSNDVLRNELTTVVQITSGHYDYYKILEGLAHFLPEPLLEEALSIVFDYCKHWDDNCARAVVALAPSLPASQLIRAWKEMLSIRDENARIEALVGLVPYLPDSDRDNALGEAFTIIQQTEYEWRKRDLLIGLAPYLLSPLRVKAMREALVMEGDDRVQILVELIPHMSKPHREHALREALAAIQTIWREEDRIEPLTKLAPYLPEPLLEETLELVLASKWCVLHGAKALTRLIPYLSEQHMRKVKTAAIAFGLAAAGGEVLEELALHLVEMGHPEEARRAAMAIQPETKQADVLMRLIAILSESGYAEEALLAAKAIKWERKRAEALTDLVSHLEEPMREEVAQEALKTVLGIRDGGERASALIRLTSFLSEILLYKSLTAIRALQPNHQAMALVNIAQILPRQLREQALKDALNAVQSITEQHEKVEAIANLLPFLAEIPHDKLYTLWCETLHLYAHYTRKDIWIDLPKLAPIIACLGGSETVSETLRAIHDIRRWWS